MKEFLIYNANLVDANISIKNSAILLNGNKIAGFPSKEAVKEILKNEKIGSYNANGATVMPAFVDMHAHFRDPGLTHKEDIVTGSMAAAAGGFGTLVLMPNTKPVCSSMELALANNAKAKEAGYCDTFQTVSITKDFDGKTISHLNELDAKKVPVITEDGKEVCDSGVMLDAMRIAAKKGIIVACHCEDPFLAEKARPFRKSALDILNGESVSAAEKKQAASYLKEADSLLALAEDSATMRNIETAALAKCAIHLCHVSTANCMDAVRRAKARGQNITCEVTPHHLALASDKNNNIFNIVNPPLRNSSDRDALIKALKDGTADCIGTDHAPHTAEDKANGAPGFSGLETAFGAVYTTLCRENGFSLKDLSKLMSYNPSRILGLKNQGLLEEDAVANLVVVDTEEQWTVRGEEFASKGKFTPLEGKKLYGSIVATFHNGEMVFQA